jgi:hypothetical protein
MLTAARAIGTMNWRWARILTFMFILVKIAKPAVYKRLGTA